MEKMEKINKPDGLPNCKIINTLISKANSKTDYEFNYVHQLEEIRNIISIEISRINLLFPEYTPHDEKYHLKRLFYVADQMLGDDLIESMNVTELFLLSVSLYAHDWGMAVSEDEKNYILSGFNESLGVNCNLLDDERIRTREFCKSKNIEIEKIKDEEWQEYVRLTHAFRSGKRIKSYFDKISTGVGEFTSRICEGHWLDFDVIDDFTSYPIDASIHRDIVNVKALTIYVRLIDLLDLGEDRTPFILWKFVAPRNKFSKLEWAKHRALQPVTFPQYQLARYIQIEGSTSDQNVYMSILDLKRYVDDQFRQCSDILSRINHSYHKLNISHIDWRIAARGFEPVEIQFEFDRNRMFEILGDEIYQGNPYVFVRELLQNSIDAIQMRTELLAKKDLSFKPKIKLEVKESEDFYIVQITDNGIGMDEYIIRNYLAVAGKSYYRSIDFQREGLIMDPISRFGIGILSCFMLADYIEIETFKDPNTTKKQEHLKISIPSKENFFKIKKNIEVLEIGTTFKIFVIKNKLPKNKEDDTPINFNITQFLKQTAGFVIYPITIVENGLETLISNPNSTIDINKNSYMIDYGFPIEESFSPQHVDTVKEYFIEKRFHLKTDLKLTDFDGCLTYLLPKYDYIDILNDGRIWPAREVKLVDYKNDLKDNKKIKWKDEWISFNRFFREKDKYIIQKRSYSVFMDGILIPNITPPEIGATSKHRNDKPNKAYVNSFIESFISPQLIVNMLKPKGMKIDLARTNVETDKRWDKPIWEAFFEHLKSTVVKDLLTKDCKDKLLMFSKLITFYKLSDEIIIERLVSKNDFPMPFISKNPLLTFKNFDANVLQKIRLAPVEFSLEFYKLIEASYFESKKYNGVLNLWGGNESFINLKEMAYKQEVASSLSNMATLTTSFLRRYYFLSSIEFVSSPLGEEFPLVQEIYNLKENFDDSENKNKIFSHIEEIEKEDYPDLRDLLDENFNYFPVIISFPPPYSSKLFYSSKYINIDTPLIKKIIQICLSAVTMKKNKKSSDEIVGRVFDMINDLPFIKSYYSPEDNIDLLDFNTKLKSLIDFCEKYNLVTIDKNFKSEVRLENFVPNSITLNKIPNTFHPDFQTEKYLKGKKIWGKLIV